MITVIVPAYNEEGYLARALEALTAQTYRDMEIIVVDNASTDRTAEIAARFPVTLIREPRKGTMWACEAGRRASQGTIIVRTDADCVPGKDWLEKGVRHFEDPKVVTVTGPCDYTDGSRWFRYAALWTQQYAYALAHALLTLGNRGILIGGNSFMRAEALEKIGGFNTDITFYGDDTDVARRISTHGKMVFDRDLVTETSVRRFEREGVLRLFATYLTHFFLTLFKE